MWKIDIWSPPVRHRVNGTLLKRGYWTPSGTVENEEQAEAAVRLATGETTGVPGEERRVVRARRMDAGDGLTGMRSGPTYFARWTGSGGQKT